LLRLLQRLLATLVIQMQPAGKKITISQPLTFFTSMKNTVNSMCNDVSDGISQKNLPLFQTRQSVAFL